MSVASVGGTAVFSSHVLNVLSFSELKKIFVKNLKNYKQMLQLFWFKSIRLLLCLLRAEPMKSTAGSLFPPVDRIRGEQKNEKSLLKQFTFSKPVTVL